MSNETNVIDIIFKELYDAEKKHPGFPDDPIYQAAIMGEEAGESLQAALQLVFEGGSKEHFIKEVAQTGAMAFRILIYLLKEEGR